MSSFKKFFNQKKFEEEIEVDEEHPGGAVYKIPLGSSYDGPIDRKELQDSYIVVEIEDEIEDGGLVEPDKLGIFKFSFTAHKEKDDEGTTDFGSIFQPNEISFIFKELNNIIYMFKEHLEREDKDFTGFSIDVEEKGEELKCTYEKIFSVLDGKLEEMSPNKFLYRLGK